ncbi:translation initiation factor IF-5A [Nanoarchaeota archaeon NZ13-N]|uniref:Translation initiation factor IF-5A n=1 Tax=Candidatus Nanoclepta minutus TaxID=1940235 RepID=A0A397WRI2_9ARCH|nr:MAG: translation initiation factor IF-5A [Nanoarchaeota archaeon NZ13-N]RIB35673.1 MAG: translation initiation factor IF-5A [Candidatus Nanoclepta minutus]
MPEIQIKKVIDLKKGSYVWYNNDVYEVLEIETSKTGKHGSAKARVVMRSLTSDKTVEIVKPTQDPIEVPIVKKIKGQVISKISEDSYMVMDLETYETFEAKVKDESLKGKIEEGNRVMVWDVGEKLIVQVFKE